ncbi:MAG: histidine kinase [Bacteroidota bacterium]
MRFKQSLVSAYRWFVQRKLYHIPFWICYTLFWYFLFARVDFWDALPTNLVYMSAYILSGYTVLYLLMPRLLFKRRYILFVLALLVSYAFWSVALGVGLMSLWKESLVGISDMEEAYQRAEFIGATFGSILPTMLIVLGIGLVKKWMSIQQKNRRLETDNLATELELLKSQLNPHFLFNAINSIYFLIRKDPDLAETSLTRFSDMLRYQLYECEGDLVPLDREIQYLRNFIELARLRKGDRVQVKFEVDESLNGEAVAPFLLMPIVENAFKHVSSHATRDNVVEIQLKKMEANKLQVNIHNTRTQRSNPMPDPRPSGGIGLSNLQRRLELLYHGRYVLDTHPDGAWYRVVLEIPLEKIAQSPSIALT